MISVDEKGFEWVGWIEVADEALPISARLLPDATKIDIHTIQVDAHLFEKFATIKEEKWFVDRVSHLEDIQLLPEFLRQVLSSRHPLFLDPPGGELGAADMDSIPQLLITELDSIGWEHFVSVSQSMDVIVLKALDQQSFEHQFEVRIPQLYPLVAPEVTVDLPVKVQLPDPFDDMDGDTYSFRRILQSVQTEINNYDDLFSVLRDLDAHTRVLPSSGSGSKYGAVPSRRLALSRTCSIKITLDPQLPRNLCQVTYMGPQEEVMTLRRHFGKNISKWSPTELVRINLQNMFETTFIEPDTSEDLSYLNECGVCYSHNLEKEVGQQRHAREGVTGATTSEEQDLVIPDQMCLNRKCGRLFHTSCLISWLQAVPTNKTSFGTLFGNCPYCSESISVRTIR